MSFAWFINRAAFAFACDQIASAMVTFWYFSTIPTVIFAFTSYVIVVLSLKAMCIILADTCAVHITEYRAYWASWRVLNTAFCWRGQATRFRKRTFACVFVNYLADIGAIYCCIAMIFVFMVCKRLQTLTCNWILVIPWQTSRPN